MLCRNLAGWKCNLGITRRPPSTYDGQARCVRNDELIAEFGSQALDEGVAGWLEPEAHFAQRSVEDFVADLERSRS